jgi:DNA-binding LacI/PurR family transcriptional regulator
MDDQTNSAPSGRSTIADVAERAGVSKGLVSFALNDRPGVNPATRRRILEIAAEMGWTPDLRARALRTNRSFALGLVRGTAAVPGDSFFPAFISGVERDLSPTGQALVLASPPAGVSEAETYRRLASERRVDGVILTDLRAADERLALVAALGLAAVTVGRPDIDSPFPAVQVDEVRGVVAMVDHLVELGHRSLAHVTGPATILLERRRRAAFEHECAIRGVQCRIIATDASAREGGEATSRLITAPDRPTAITYSNDRMALAGIGVAQRAGLTVPGDLSIAAFDESDIAQYVFPSLTSVVTDAEEWGALAARTLLAAIAGVELADTTPPPTRLNARESTAIAPGARSPR